MNYKLIITLAAVALIAASCAKNEAGIAPQQKGLTPVQLTLSLSQTGEPATRPAFYVKDEANPRQLRATWQKNDLIELIIWQDGNDWKTDPKLIEKTIFLPASAEGQTSVNLSSLAPALDLSAYDNTKPLKYAVVKCGSWIPKEGVIFSSSGISQKWDATLASAPGQLHHVMLATPVQTAAVPTAGNPLVLQGKLEWRCALLALKFNIAPNADVVYGNNTRFILKKPTFSSTQNYPQLSYDPVLMKADALAGDWAGMNLSMKDKKLSELAVTPQGYRYFAIPADDENFVKVTGSQLAFTANKPNGSMMLDGAPITTLKADVSIKAGFCYSLNLKVTDANNDGIPEFARE